MQGLRLTWSPRFSSCVDPSASTFCKFFAAKMTIDDENSVYVGGLPYTASEDLIRREFSPYGTVVDIKIVNDRSVRGKCYGFVTFTNPRSAADAIDDMDGRVIGGRKVRVNEVTTRFGRLNPGRDRSQYGDRGRGRERARVYYHDRDMHCDRYHGRSRERHRSRDHYMEKSMERESSHDHDRADNLVSDRDRERERDLEDDARERSRGNEDNWEGEHKSDEEQDREIDENSDSHRGVIEEKALEPIRPPSRDHHSRDRHSRDQFSESSDEHELQVKEQLEGSIQLREELRREILELEDQFDVQERLVTDLQKKSKRLEDALIGAKRQTSERKKQLTKLHKSFLQVNDCTEKLQNCERELQALVDSTVIELGSKDEVLVNS